MSYFSLDQITKIKIPPKVTIKHNKVIEGRWWLSVIYIIDPEQGVEDSVVDDDGTALYEYYQVGLGYSGASEHFYLAKIKQLEELQQDVNTILFCPIGLNSLVF